MIMIVLINKKYISVIVRVYCQYIRTLAHASTIFGTQKRWENILNRDRPYTSTIDVKYSF